VLLEVWMLQQQLVVCLFVCLCVFVCVCVCVSQVWEDGFVVVVVVWKGTPDVRCWKVK